MRNGFVVAIGYSFLLLTGVSAQVRPDLPPCGSARPTSVGVPWSGDGSLWCLEAVSHDAGAGAVGYTALVAGPGDTLYAVMPDLGRLVRFDDTDDDLLPDTPTTLANGLTRPTGVTRHDGNIYIAGLNTIYRYEIATETLDVLVADFPGGWAGWPAGGMAVMEDWLYVGAGGDSACTAGRGAVWRFRLDGTEGETYATGIAAPMGLTVFEGRLYVTDAAIDTLWLLEPGADYGACSGVTPPALSVATFEVGATPIAIAAYDATLFPVLTGRLLVALQGSGGDVLVSGYEVIGVDPAGAPPHETVLPRNPPHLGLSDQRMHIQGSGFYPSHVYGVAVDARGWIYISAGNGKIVALRNL